MSETASGDNLRADLASQLEQMRADPAPEPTSAEPDAPLTEDKPILTEGAAEETAQQKADRARDDAGRFAKEAKKAKEAPRAPVVETKPKLAAVPKPEDAAATVKPTTPAVKAPASWRPEVREKWGAIPPEAQAEIARREREVTTALQQTAPMRERAAQWDQTLAPHQEMIRALGGNPIQVVAPMLEAQKVLMYGSEAQKAGFLATIIKGYRVGVEALAAALDGTAAPAQATPVAQPAQFRDPRVDNLLEQAKTRQKALADRSWASFAAEHEYADELRRRVIALAEVVAQDAPDAELKDVLAQAYDMALHAHPEYRKVVEQRKAAETATAQAAATQAKKAAASSLRAVPGGIGGPDDGAPTTGRVGDDLRFIAARMRSK